MKRIHKIFLYVVIMLSIGLQNVLATNTEEAAQLAEYMTQYLCEDAIYLGCIHLSGTECAKTMRRAINTCPRIYIESLDVETSDVLCITNEFFEIAKIPATTAKSCDGLLKPVSKPLNNRMSEFMHNKPMKSDAAEPRR